MAGWDDAMKTADAERFAARLEECAKLAAAALREGRFVEARQLAAGAAAACSQLLFECTALAREVG